jgi:hypothetical protein
MDTPRLSRLMKNYMPKHHTVRHFQQIFQLFFMPTYFVHSLSDIIDLQPGVKQNWGLWEVLELLLVSQ